MIHYSGLFRVEAVVCVSISGFEWSLSRLFDLLTRRDSFTDGGLEYIEIPVHVCSDIPIDRRPFLFFYSAKYNSSGHILVCVCLFASSPVMTTKRISESSVNKRGSLSNRLGERPIHSTRVYTGDQCQ